MKPYPSIIYLKKLVVAATALLLMAPVAEGAEWVFVAGNDESQIFLDSASIKEIKKDQYSVWAKATFIGDVRDFRGIPLNSLISLKEIDCTEGKSRIIQTTTYFEDGSKESNPNIIDWRDITPDSLEDSVRSFVC